VNRASGVGRLTTSVPRRIEVAALRALLRVLGVLMVLASRRVARFRRQVTRDLLVEIGSDDGVRQQFQLRGASRTMTLPRGPVGNAECTLIFPSAREGLRALLSSRAIGRIIEGVHVGGTRIEGNPVLLLWFHGLTRIVAPIGSTRRPRRRERVHVPVRSPEYDLPYSRRIVREPVVDRLTGEWPQAWVARSKLLQIRCVTGEEIRP
jgi:hypothetical protein